MQTKLILLARRTQKKFPLDEYRVYVKSSSQHNKLEKIKHLYVVVELQWKLTNLDTVDGIDQYEIRSNYMSTCTNVTKYNFSEMQHHLI